MTFVVRPAFALDTAFAMPFVLAFGTLSVVTFSVATAMALDSAPVALAVAFVVRLAFALDMLFAVAFALALILALLLLHLLSQ